MKIKAAVLNAMGVAPPYEQSKPLSVEEIDLEGPGHGEVLVRIECGAVTEGTHTIAKSQGDQP